MDESDRQKSTFRCHMGLYQFRVMPFGLSRAPGFFSQLMSIDLSGKEGFEIAYLDGILVFSKDPEEHFRHLQLMFDRLRQHELRPKL